MKITGTRVYRGPNMYALFPMIRLTVDLGPLEDWPTGRLGRGFVDDLLEALPGLREHGCSYGEPGGLVRRMTEDEGTWLGHVLEHVAIELQNVAGAEVTFGKTRGTGQEREYSVVYEFEAEPVGLAAGQLGIDLLHSLLPSDLIDGDARKPDFDFAAERDAFIKAAQRRQLGPSTAALVKAARERDVPYIRLNERSLLQLGHGKYQKRVQATVTGETRHIAVELASDKEETVKILGDLGLPVPRQRMVMGVREAVRAAERIGFPVVVKPLDANHGRGISINLTTPEQVAAAYEEAREHSRGVVVETFLEGFDHRLLVVDGELIAAAKRVPGHVLGDGRHTIEELVEVVNQDPRRGVGHEKVLTRLELDAQAERCMARLGYDRTTVPAEAETVYLRSTANLSTGGTALDVTDVIHPDNREMAVRAVKAIGLDVGGVDFLTTDITRSYKETGGGICEVNAAPGFRMHVSPSEGTPRDVAGPVMDMLFKPGTSSRIPIAAITGTNGKTTTARMLAHIFKMSGHTVGMTSTDGVYIDGRLTVKGDMTGPMAAQMVLRDPTVDAAVLETARGGLVRSGLGYERCDVGCVLNVSADHLGLGGIDTLDDLAHVKRVVVEVATEAAVLNADDPLCLRMADHTSAKAICYVTMNPAHPLVREHLRAGGKAVVLEQGINGHMITLYDGGAPIQLLWTHLIPATLEGRAMHNVQNAMFAAAVAYCSGKHLDNIRQGLRTFDATFFQTPGRMNVFNEHPFRVIVDYGHNPAAVQAMCRVVEALKPRGKRIVLLTAPGDRRDEDIAEIGRIAAGVFDHYICKRDDNLRGRGPDEVPERLSAALRANGVDANAIERIADEETAVAEGLVMARPDDLVMIFADNYTRCWKQVIYFNRPIDGEATAPGSDAEPVASAPEPPPLEALDLDTDLGGELVRDERGVRLRAEPEEAD
jgi:cyanophycin synthetase